MLHGMDGRHAWSLPQLTDRVANHGPALRPSLSTGERTQKFGVKVALGAELASGLPSSEPHQRFLLSALGLLFGASSVQRGRLARKALNEQQAAAVVAPAGAHAVIAGAGSGKTKTLTSRLAHLVSAGTDPSRVLLITFTNQAAQDMKARAQDEMSTGDLGCITACTFHSLCWRILQKYPDRAGFRPDFTVLDAEDSIQIISDIRRRFNLQYKIPKAKALSWMFSQYANRDDASGASVDWDDGIKQVHVAYEESKQDQNCLDFDDLLVHCNKLLEQEDDIREYEAQQWEHVLVDEYQDTNYLQASIARHLTTVHGNIMVVGDDAQTIYGWRGARVENIWEFGHVFATESVFRLEENYRSTQQILDLANAVLRGSRQGYGLQLRSNRPGGPRPLLHNLFDCREEARLVARKIFKLREEGVSPEKVAVLYRTNNTPKLLESELVNAGIDYEKVGGMKFTDRTHIKDLIAVLSIAVNPYSEPHWTRVLSMFPGVGKANTALITKQVACNNPPQLDPELWRGKKYYPHLCKLAELIDAVNDTSCPHLSIELAIKWYEEYLRRLEDWPERREDFETLLRSAEGLQSLPDLLAALQMQSVRNKGSNNKLTLSTIHSAKGLEWDVVFLMGLGRAFAFNGEEAEESRRLLYVALTRAKKKLTLTNPDGWKGLTWLLADVPSLDEVVEEAW
mmetsp:Transcript_49652/g.115867  ORF Transcript_49652/g.115867 Transcript_49652/m.115867 type:complete len:682 (-) Transcript_49652:22-2067(-)